MKKSHGNILAFAPDCQFNLQKKGVEKKLKTMLAQGFLHLWDLQRNGGLGTPSMDFGGDSFYGTVFLRREHALGTSQLSTFGTPQHCTFEKTDFSGWVNRFNPSTCASGDANRRDLHAMLGAYPTRCPMPWTSLRVCCPCWVFAGLVERKCRNTTKKRS